MFLSQSGFNFAYATHVSILILILGDGDVIAMLKPVRRKRVLETSLSNCIIKLESIT